MIPTHNEHGHVVYHGSSLAEHDLPDGPIADAIVTDPPYSGNTHEGHNSHQRRDRAAMFNDAAGLPSTTKVGRQVNYGSWDAPTVELAVRLWAPLNRGWWVVLTDHILAPSWADELEHTGLYVFAPLPFLSVGSRVRLAGDGPSSWTCWIVVARPKHPPYSKWGTLPGGYVIRPERNMPVVGGKPLSLMRALVRDYSNEGDTIWDPCCGGGTTLAAAKELRRNSIGMDIDREHAEISAERVQRASALYLPGCLPARGEQTEIAEVV